MRALICVASGERKESRTAGGEMGGKGAQGHGGSGAFAKAFFEKGFVLRFEHIISSYHSLDTWANYESAQAMPVKATLKRRACCTLGRATTGSERSTLEPV